MTIPILCLTWLMFYAILVALVKDTLTHTVSRQKVILLDLALRKKNRYIPKPFDAHQYR